MPHSALKMHLQQSFFFYECNNFGQEQDARLTPDFLTQWNSLYGKSPAPIATTEFSPDLCPKHFQHDALVVEVQKCGYLSRWR